MLFGIFYFWHDSGIKVIQKTLGGPDKEREKGLRRRKDLEGAGQKRREVRRERSGGAQKDWEGDKIWG